MHWKPASWLLISVLLAACTASASAQIATTQVTDTIYHAGGTTATGTVLISWPAFTTASGAFIPSGSTSAAIAANGVLSIALTPNAGATPMGTYYTATYHLDDGTVSRQYWVVPAGSGPVKISAIESTVLPTSVAMQTVSKNYVDSAIAASTRLLLASGNLQSHEDPRVFLGTCATGCTPDSTSVMVAPTAFPGTQGDGRFLIDTAPAKTITSISTDGVLVGGSATGPHASAQFSGTNFPVSIFLALGQVVPSQANNIAPGMVTFFIATTGVATGYATNTAAIGSVSGLACVVDQTAGTNPNNYEMAPYTVVDPTHLQMTFNKPHQMLASLAFGGLCGYALEQTVDTADGVRQLFPVLGANSATSLYYAGAVTPIVGIMGQTSGFLNVSAPIASLTRTGGAVTAITTSNLAANISVLPVTVAGAGDSSYNGTYLVTTTGTNSFTYVQSGANSSTTGGTVSILTGGFALYPMAEVLSVFDQATKSIDGQFTLAPNNVAWAANDTVEEPHFYQENVTADTEYLGQSLPRPSITTRAGLQYQQNNGPGLIGWSIQNAAPTANYLGYGGTHSAPDTAYEATGVWRRTMNLTAGEQAAFAVHCNLHGCGSWNSGYNLFELDSSAGADTVAYSPSSSSLSLIMRGTSYSFTPQAFNAGVINVGTLNATTINGVAIGGSHVATVTLQHTFAGAGTFNYAHNLGALYPLMTCYVNGGSPAYSAGNVDTNNIAITVTAASDITCTFGI